MGRAASNGACGTSPFARLPAFPYRKQITRFARYAHMKKLLLAALLTSCATTNPDPVSMRRIASEKKEKKDYLKLIGTKYFDGPEALNLEAMPGREAKVFLPKDYAKKQKLPLILLLHGYTSYADEVNFYLGLGAGVTEHGYILLTPEGTTDPKGDQFWNATPNCCDLHKTGVDDVSYLLALVEEAAKKYKVDRERIYLYGHSNGGFMGNRLLCETEGVFAGMVNVAGSTFKDPSQCRLKNPVSYLQVHALDDPTVAFDAVDWHPGGKRTAELRADAAGCEAPETGERKDIVFLVPFRDTTVTAWKKCSGGREVMLWAIDASKMPKHKPHAPGFWWPAFVNSTLDWVFRFKAYKGQ